MSDEHPFEQVSTRRGFLTRLALIGVGATAALKIGMAEGAALLAKPYLTGPGAEIATSQPETQPKQAENNPRIADNVTTENPLDDFAQPYVRHRRRVARRVYRRRRRVVRRTVRRTRRVARRVRRRVY